MDKRSHASVLPGGLASDVEEGRQSLTGPLLASWPPGSCLDATPSATSRSGAEGWAGEPVRKHELARTPVHLAMLLQSLDLTPTGRLGVVAR
jgi:hypothetical protein